MRILLAQNSLYYPSPGGGDKSNRLLEALPARTGKFGEREQGEFLDQLAARPVAAASHAGAVIFERLRRRGTRKHP